MPSRKAFACHQSLGNMKDKLGPKITQKNEDGIIIIVIIL